MQGKKINTQKQQNKPILIKPENTNYQQSATTTNNNKYWQELSEVGTIKEYTTEEEQADIHAAKATKETTQLNKKVDSNLGLFAPELPSRPRGLGGMPKRKSKIPAHSIQLVGEIHHDPKRNPFDSKIKKQLLAKHGRNISRPFSDTETNSHENTISTNNGKEDDRDLYDLAGASGGQININDHIKKLSNSSTETNSHENTTGTNDKKEDDRDLYDLAGASGGHVNRDDTKKKSSQEQSITKKYTSINNDDLNGLENVKELGSKTDGEHVVASQTEKKSTGKGTVLSTRL
ncbi:hypothetical protein CAXC1_180017 [Candidatus Xenohaliotis californiensis]|uniref:Uncharacterized protein n=1 Tax=Candidatus Xenohaliotis californiensis TaxID=84677 RepID=A0ABM9N7D5_9RICK|nr:hypothetical protein CAXC1_180017 [Candidatus Xenohaliotis californiensis]